MQNPDCFVRAERPSDRALVTTTRAHAVAAGWRIVDRPALDVHGRPLPPKPHEVLGTKRVKRSKLRAAKTGGTVTPSEARPSADTEKESS